MEQKFTKKNYFFIPGLLKVSTKTGETIEDVDCLLWAIGRTSSTKDLGLEQGNILFAIFWFHEIFLKNFYFQYSSQC